MLLTTENALLEQVQRIVSSRKDRLWRVELYMLGIVAPCCVLADVSAVLDENVSVGSLVKNYALSQGGGKWGKMLPRQDWKFHYCWELISWLGSITVAAGFLRGKATWNSCV